MVADAETDEDLAILADAAGDRGGSAGRVRRARRRRSPRACRARDPERGRRAVSRSDARSSWWPAARTRPPAPSSSGSDGERASTVLSPALGPGRRRSGAASARWPAAWPTPARARVERSRPGALLLTGGETAIAVLRALGAGGLRLAGEIEPGVALGALVGGPFDGLALVTKAGGFGDPDLLVRVWEACA